MSRSPKPATAAPNADPRDAHREGRRLDHEAPVGVAEEGVGHVGLRRPDEKIGEGVAVEVARAGERDAEARHHREGRARAAEVRERARRAAAVERHAAVEGVAHGEVGVAVAVDVAGRDGGPEGLREQRRGRVEGHRRARPGGAAPEHVHLAQVAREARRAHDYIGVPIAVEVASGRGGGAEGVHAVGEGVRRHAHRGEVGRAVVHQHGARVGGRHGEVAVAVVVDVADAHGQRAEADERGVDDRRRGRRREARRAAEKDVEAVGARADHRVGKPIAVDVTGPRDAGAKGARGRAGEVGGRREGERGRRRRGDACGRAGVHVDAAGDGACGQRGRADDQVGETVAVEVRHRAPRGVRARGPGVGACGARRKNDLPDGRVGARAGAVEGPRAPVVGARRKAQRTVARHGPPRPRGGGAGVARVHGATRRVEADVELGVARSVGERPFEGRAVGRDHRARQRREEPRRGHRRARRVGRDVEGDVEGDVTGDVGRGVGAEVRRGVGRVDEGHVARRRARGERRVAHDGLAARGAAHRPLPAEAVDGKAAALREKHVEVDELVGPEMYDGLLREVVVGAPEVGLGGDVQRARVARVGRDDRHLAGHAKEHRARVDATRRRAAVVARDGVAQRREHRGRRAFAPGGEGDRAQVGAGAEVRAHHDHELGGIVGGAAGRREGHGGGEEGARGAASRAHGVTAGCSRARVHDGV